MPPQMGHPTARPHADNFGRRHHQPYHGAYPSSRPFGETGVVPTSERMTRDEAPYAADDGPPVTMQFAVRFFKIGARSHLAQYNLAPLQNPPDNCEAAVLHTTHGNQQNLGPRLLEAYRPSDYYSSGIDAVALGLVSLGPNSVACPYALRTLTATDEDTVRISNAACDFRLPEYLDFDKVLNFFDSQLVHLSVKLLPRVRFLAVEARRGSKNHSIYTERGLQIIDNDSSMPRGTLFFREWMPSVAYAQTFRHNEDVVYLRAEISRLVHTTNPEPSVREPFFHNVFAYYAATGPHAHQQHQMPPPAAGNELGVTPRHAPAPARVNAHDDRAATRAVRSPDPQRPTPEQIAQWSSQIGVPVPRHTAAAVEHQQQQQPQQPHQRHHDEAAYAPPNNPMHHHGFFSALDDAASAAAGQAPPTFKTPGQRRTLTPAERKARELKAAQRQLRQIRNHQNGVLSKKRPGEAPPAWVKEVREWAQRVLKHEPEARLHVSKLRDEFLRSRSNEEFLRRLRGDAAAAEPPAIDYDQLKRLFSLPKSHESRLFTITILSVVGVRAKRQQCVIGGINQCGIVGFKIDYADTAPLVNPPLPDDVPGTPDPTLAQTAPLMPSDAPPDASFV